MHSRQSRRDACDRAATPNPILRLTLVRMAIVRRFPAFQAGDIYPLAAGATQYFLAGCCLGRTPFFRLVERLPGGAADAVGVVHMVPVGRVLQSEPVLQVSASTFAMTRHKYLPRATHATPALPVYTIATDPSRRVLVSGMSWTLPARFQAVRMICQLRIASDGPHRG